MDQHLAEDLIQEIGSAILNDRSYIDRSWTALSLVAIVDGGVVQLSGYTFDSKGVPKPSLPNDGSVDEMFERLQRAMQIPGKEPWKTCLFRIKRDPMRVRLDVDYDDPLRWNITPATMSRVLQEIGPNNWPG